MTDTVREVGLAVARVADRMGVMDVDTFMRHFDADREHRAAIADNLAAVAKLEAEAVRITTGPSGRCFVMADGRLFVIYGEQPAGTDILYCQYIVPVSPEDAEQFYGWTP